ncbi:hypothetical protein GCM10010384_31670 [Streptomyces djakartensis]|uniref:Uncharacterized protein n=1 Tax=Streptomyces djakartensis TaxID=68193 RepID=A0ABQ2ZTV3_9ACTN|nr:hypothetical protein GCM10010384_31670 [Streptomyces djakartensis]
MPKAPDYDQSGAFWLMPPAGFEPATPALGVPSTLTPWAVVVLPGEHQAARQQGLLHSGQGGASPGEGDLFRAAWMACAWTGAIVSPRPWPRRFSAAPVRKCCGPWASSSAEARAWFAYDDNGAVHRR